MEYIQFLSVSYTDDALSVTASCAVQIEPGGFVSVRRNLQALKLKVVGIALSVSLPLSVYR